MPFAAQWGAKTAVLGPPSEPALGAIPLGCRGEAIGSWDPRLPQFARDWALGIDDPVGMTKIGGAVGGQLRLVAAQQTVGPRADPKQSGRDRNADAAPADGGSE